MNENDISEKVFHRLFVLSALLCLITLFLCCTRNGEEIYIPVSSTNVSQNNSDASADADGYLNGKWNIWEFIGDFFSGMIE